MTPAGTRTQLTLFVDERDAAGIEKVRDEHNPAQFRLIHITLMHPRSSTCTDALFEAIENATLPSRLTFGTISLIEQIDGSRWEVLETFQLSSRGVQHARTLRDE